MHIDSGLEIPLGVFCDLGAAPLLLFLLLLSLSVLVSGSSLLSAFASSASLVVPLSCVLSCLRVSSLLPLHGVGVLSFFSLGGAWGVFLVLLRSA